MSIHASGSPFGTFVLPVYNAGAFLRRNLAELHAWLSARPEPWELIVVDDASNDGTARILEEFVEQNRDEAIAVVRLSGNRGKGFCIRVGLGRARGEVCLFTDCDLAYPLENATRIVEALRAGADAAIACRVLPRSSYTMSPTFFSYLYTRHLLGRAFNLLCRTLTVPDLLDTQAGMKGFRTAVVRPLLGRLAMDGFSFDVELLRALLDRGARIIEIPVSFRYDSEPSTVRFFVDSLAMLRDLVLIRLRSLRGRYRAVSPAGASAAALVVHADDFGLSPGINRVIAEGLESGFLTGASILTGGLYVRTALAWAASHPQYDYGAHLNLTQGRPVLPPDRVPSLVGRRGRFRPLGWLILRMLLGRIRADEVRAEWRAQIALTRSSGVSISHLDSHQHVHLLSPLFPVAAALARENGVTLRGMDGPAGTTRFLPDCKGLLLALLTRSAARQGGNLLVAAGFGTALMGRPTLYRLRALLGRLRPGRVYELVVHPGMADLALRRCGDRYREVREVEWRLLASEEFRSVISLAGLRPISFREITHRLGPPPAGRAVVVSSGHATRQSSG